MVNGVGEGAKAKGGERGSLSVVRLSAHAAGTMLAGLGGGFGEMSKG